MASLVNEIRAFASGGPSANIDNHVFRAHYVFSSGLLLTAAGILITSQFFGDPIDCIASADYDRADAAKKSIDNFCWVSATYTVEELYGDNTQIGVNKIDEGVGQFIPGLHTARFQLHYRWISLLLIIQAIIFYVPHYFWKSWESGKMEGLSTMLNIPIEPTLDGDRRRARIELLLNHLEAYDTNALNYYTYRFYFCEFANFIALLINIWLSNWITDGLFWNIGSDFWNKGYHSRVLAQLFPLQAKCLWRIVGPSGSIQQMDALCILPSNSFNKVFFAVLWFWYLLLGVATLGWLIFRSTTFVMWVRSTLLRWKACSVNECSHFHSEGTDCIDYITKHLPHPDFFVVLQLVDNVDTVAIKSILGGLCERLGHRQRRRPSSIITGAESKPLLH